MAQGDGDGFTIIVLPDTQFYSHRSPDMFTSQTQWIVDNKDKLNIVFVTHVGDIVYDFNVEQDWNNARAAMDLLDDASIQYGVLPGNHDGAMQWHWGDTKNYNTYFSLNRFKNKPGWGGHFDSTSIDPPAEYSGDMDATYQLFGAGGDNYIIIHLQYCPFAQHRAWASDILKQYSDRKAIISTHGYLDHNGTLLDSHPDGHKIQEGSGEDIWNDVVLPNDNVFMVLCGHVGGGAELLRTTTIGDRTVYQILTDYQYNDSSHDAANYLRIMTFEPDEDKIYVKTYSPNLDKYQTDANSQFELNFIMTGEQVSTPTPPLDIIPWEPPIWAIHAGGRWDYTENTMKAIQKSKELGATYIEIDLRTTKDNVVILMHDDMINRTTNGSGKVSDLMWADIKNLQAGNYGETVPCFDDVLQYAKMNNLKLLLDVNDVEACPLLYDLINQKEMIDNVKVYWAAMNADVRNAHDPKINKFTGSLAQGSGYTRETCPSLVLLALQKPEKYAGSLIETYQCVIDALKITPPPVVKKYFVTVQSVPPNSTITIA